MLLREQDALKRQLVVGHIKDFKQLVLPSKEKMELNFVGILTKLLLLRLVSIRLVVITLQLLQIQIVRHSCPEPPEPLIQNVLLLELDVLTILEVVQALMELLKNVAHLRL